MDGENDGIEKELREKVQPRYLKTVAPTPISSAMEHTSRAVERLVLMIRDVVRDIESQFDEPNLFIVGRSFAAYVAHLALIADNEFSLKKVSRAILIEGPLHPEVLVEPPKFPVLPPFFPQLPFLPLTACGAHYKLRPELAQEAANRLQELGTSHLVLVQGGCEDSIVPVEAQTLPGDFETIELSNDDLSRIHPANGQGIIVKLPPHIGGRSGGIRRIFPVGLRNHLFWSKAKMEMIRRIIERAADS